LFAEDSDDDSSSEEENTKEEDNKVAKVFSKTFFRSIKKDLAR